MRRDDWSGAQEDRMARVQKVAVGCFLLVVAVLLAIIYAPEGWIPSARLAPGDPADLTPLARAGLWLKTMTVGRTTPWVVLVALVALGGAVVREFRRDDRNEDAPGVLALLLALYALAWMTLAVAADPWVLRPAAAARAGLPPPSLYHVVTGLLWLTSAVYLYFGRRVARSWYGLSLAVVLVWSGLEHGVNARAFWAQVTMPVLLGLYLFSWRVSGRLQPAPD